MVDAAQAGVKHMNIDYKSSKRGIAFWVVLSLFVLISIILIAATPDILPAILDKAEVLGLGTNDSLVYNQQTDQFEQTSFSFDPKKKSLLKGFLFKANKFNIVFDAKACFTPFFSLQQISFGGNAIINASFSMVEMPDSLNLDKANPIIYSRVIYQNFSYSLKRAICLDLIYVPAIRSDNYYLLLEFSNKTDLSTVFQNLYIKINYVDEIITIFLYILRTSLFVIHLLAFLVFLYWLFRNPVHQKLTFETKEALVLGIGLLLFNDPFFRLQILYPNELLNYFSAVMVGVFIILLYRFWMNMSTFISQEGEEFSRWPIRVLIVLFSIAVLGYYISYHTTAGNLLNINFVSNKATVVAFTVILGIFMAATLLYLCVQLFKSLKRCSEQPWRNKVFLGLSLVYIPLLTAGVCGLALSFYRFGKYSIVLLLNVNIYCWAQMFLYTPVKSDELRAAEPIQGIESNSNFNTEYANNPENEIVYKEDDPNKEGEDKDYNNLGQSEQVFDFQK